jgi:hypothetical protein
VDLRELAGQLEAQAAARVPEASCSELRELASVLPPAGRAVAEARLAACR